MTEQIKTEHLGDSEEKEHKSCLCSGTGFLLRTVVWCTCLLRHPGTGQSKNRCPGILRVTFSLEPGVLGIKISSNDGLECTHDGFILDVAI